MLFNSKLYMVIKRFASIIILQVMSTNNAGLSGELSVRGCEGPARYVRILLTKCCVQYKQVYASKETRTIVTKRTFNMTRNIC